LGQDGPAHLVPLGQTGWSLWREGALRSAGFPASGLLAVCDRELADAVDTAERSGGPGGPAGADLAGTFQAAGARLTAAVAKVAADPAFREAVAWQNPALIGACLDKLVRGERRNVRGRLHESAVVRYLQRYLLKNDTIGFFGPVGWVELSPGVAGLPVTPGEELLAGRTTHFEMWAIDAFARALARQPELSGSLIPRPALAVLVTGRTLRRPLRPAAELTDAEVAVLAWCDGRRTVGQVIAGSVGQVTAGSVGQVTADSPIRPGDAAGGAGDAAGSPGGAAGGAGDAAGSPGGAAGSLGGAGSGGRGVRLRALIRLAQLGAVHLGLDGPVDSWPERALRRKLEAVGDPAARGSALARLDALTAARDAMADAHDADDLVKRAAELADVFGEFTGAGATRRAGEAYAGRTLVYQDARRNVAVTVGRAVLGELAAPLGLLLDSARWLVARAAAEYRDLFAALYTGEATGSGSAQVPLGHLIALAAPDLTATGHALPPPVQAAVLEFQRRWLQVLSWPDGARRHEVSSAALAQAATREFGGATVPWRTAVHHSPDIMIAATGPEAVRRGDFLLVLGELHLAVNSLESRFFVQHHDDPRRLLAAAEADFGDQRIYAALPKSSPFVSSRVWPPIALLSPRYTYWSWSGEPSSVEPPGPVLAGAGLTVCRRDGELRVVSAETGVGYDLLEVIGEILSTAVVDSFRPFAAAPHRPRITVDRLVIARESWTFRAADTGWAFVKDESSRFAAARAWRAGHGLPERVFAVLPVERKPIGVDFASLPLVNILAKEVRRTAEAGEQAFSVTEMLPDLGEMWLPDRAGHRYASEFRLVAFDATGA
jgi:hypothetical protein